MREYDPERVKNRLAKRAEERKRNPIPEHLQRKLEHDREVQHLWLSARNRAREFEREFNITTEDIVIPEVCPVLGIPLKRSRQAYVKPNSPSLDRIDNSRGYIKGNVCVISHRANTLKSNATLEELTLILVDAKEIANRTKIQRDEEIALLVAESEKDRKETIVR